jgi:cobalt-precorrin-5B (C1)-methyltransferase
MTRKRLREGFTTGSAAAAGAKAALLFLSGKKRLKKVNIPLPVGGRLSVPVEQIERIGQGARVTIIKDAGDDPDVTHKAKIRATVNFVQAKAGEEIIIKGGKGVGKVTRPGLPIPVGEPAINPAPRRQIREAVREGLTESGLRGTVSVTIDVVDGEKIAKKTLNPRLGIVGGISILGTRGTVKPFSNKAYRDTITASMDVAKASGLNMIALSTGGKSEGFLKKQYPELSEVAFIQVADFFSFSLQEAVRRGFQDILYACFFGKIIKMAQGHPYTHAHDSEIDFDLLAQWCGSLGMDEKKTISIKKANTGREARGVIRGDVNGEIIFNDIVKRAILSARTYAGPFPNITYHLFDFDGELLATQRDEGTCETSRQKTHGG